MKSLLKKGTLLIVVLSALFNNVYAADFTSNQNNFGGDSEIPYVGEAKTYEEQKHEIQMDMTLTDIQKETLLDKLSISQSFDGSTGDVSLFSLCADYPLDVPYVKQAKNYYCGPATVEQTLRFFLGTSDTQYEIAEDLQVETYGGISNGDTMRAYINARIPEENAYIEVQSPEKQEMLNNMVLACVSYGPPILRMTSSAGMWQYTTNGHFLNVSGSYNDGTTHRFRLTDPYIEWIDATNTSGTYFESIDRIYAVTMAHWRQSFWW